jgi:hypothetical protein
MFLHYRHHEEAHITKKYMFIKYYLLPHVLVKFWCEQPEDIDNAGTCRRQATEII